MEHFLDQYGYAAIFFVALVEAVCIPFPSELTFGLSAALIAEGKVHGISLVGLIVLGVVGEICGCVAAYAIGRSGGRALIDRYGKYVLLTHADLDRTDRFMARRGSLSVFFGRFIPLVRAEISLVAGIGEMPFRRFLLSTALATALYGTALALIGHAVGNSWHHVAKVFTYAGVVVIVLVVLVVVLGVVHRVRALRAERDVTR